MDWQSPSWSTLTASQSNLVQKSKKPGNKGVTTMAKPTIVGVHGAWHSAAHFLPLKENLAQYGYKFIAVLLPSMHYAELKCPPPIHIKEDVEAIQTAILTELNDYPATDVVVLTHSYGGMPGSAAVENLDKNSRKAAGFSNGISALLAISSLLVNEGISGFDLGNKTVPPTIILSKIPSPVDNNMDIEISMPNPEPGPTTTFYHDLPQKDAEHYASLLVPHVWTVYCTPVPFAGFKVVPTYYLLTEDDKSLPPEWQRLIIKMADEVTLHGKIVVDTIHASHSPFLSKVDETATWIRRSLGEKF
ncbi:hypothetical protein LTR84_005909 [Exophiala bonariae]|uniref:AB hydrolase-1 domain-containing protein n=1 Tax=Exophiala bonariae TaxID=1690606 RepID=A0AAV9N679_9EURO|nr:hypothetical protein LTR84_005909 [Exophiala bonariae]